MVNCNPSRTPIDTDSKLGPDGVPVQDPTLYRSLAGGSSILPLLAQICLMHSTGTWSLVFSYIASATTSKYGTLMRDWQGWPFHRSAEAEYRGVANVVAETAWIRNLLRELHSPLLTATLVYCDNAGHDRVLNSSHFQQLISSPKVFPQLCLKIFTPV
ncbi:ribonuclease H-like domain-containing protein [Tanacetum coccineum]